MNAIQSYFSPRGQIADKIIASINAALRSVHLLMYEFSDAMIANAIIQATVRGLHVQVVLDPGNDKLHDSCLPMLLAHGVPTWIDHAHAIMHSKTMVIDNAIVITGSYNYTISAEYRNAESILWLCDATTAALATGNFNLHLSHSVIATAAQK